MPEVSAHAVAGESHERKLSTEKQNLRRYRSARWIDELRQEREKEERGFRVEYVDHNALCENSRQFDARRVNPRVKGLASPDFLYPEINQVRGAQIFHGGKCQRG